MFWNDLIRFVFLSSTKMPKWLILSQAPFFAKLKFLCLLTSLEWSVVYHNLSFNMFKRIILSSFVNFDPDFAIHHSHTKKSCPTSIIYFCLKSQFCLTIYLSIQWDKTVSSVSQLFFCYAIHHSFCPRFFSFAVAENKYCLTRAFSFCQCGQFCLTTTFLSTWFND